MDWKANAWSEKILKCTEKAFYNWAWGRGWEETSTIMVAEFVCLFVLFKTQLAHCVSLSQIYNTLQRDFIDRSLSWGWEEACFPSSSCLNGSFYIWRWEETLSEVAECFSLFVLFVWTLEASVFGGERKHCFLSLRLVWTWGVERKHQATSFRFFPSLSFDKNPSATRMPCVGGLIAFNFGETFI